MHSLSAASAVRDSEGVTFETFLLDRDKAVEWGEQRILVEGRWHLSSREGAAWSSTEWLDLYTKMFGFVWTQKLSECW